VYARGRDVNRLILMNYLAAVKPMATFVDRVREGLVRRSRRAGEGPDAEWPLLPLA